MNIFEAGTRRARGCSQCLFIEWVRAVIVLAVLVSLLDLGAREGAFAQSVNGLISGAVFDQQYRPVSGATVRAIDQLNMTSQTTRTNEDGFFVFTELRPGKYTLSVEKDGFANLKMADILVLTADRRYVGALILKVGSSTEVLMVTSESPAIETTSSEQSTVISHRLHSSKLEYLGLEAASSSFCVELSERQNVKINFHSDGIPEELASVVSLSLFRVLQESLHNAVKYSGVNEFDVSLTNRANEIQLRVHDSGAGFDQKATSDGHGLGLISMRERLKSVGGVLSINSKPGCGTTVLACVPFVDQTTAHDPNSMVRAVAGDVPKTRAIER